jgi:pimeloyl-ACP methyl ester carboxylesterase
MNPHPFAYHPATAAFLAAVSAAAYRPDAGAAWLAARGHTLAVVQAARADTRALIACDGQDCVVAFRGTQDLRNWLTDLDCAFARMGNLRVHRGFYEALESVRQDLEAGIEGLRYERLWLTGHSLGGALAMLCAHAWAGRVEGVYTFGQPRAGDAKFRDNYNERLGARTFRLVHSDDIVARVPWLLGRFRHAGHEIFFPSPSGRGIKGEGGWVQDAPLLQKLPSDLRGLAREWSFGPLALLNDHHINRYLALLPQPDAPVCFSHA